MDIKDNIVTYGQIERALEYNRLTISDIEKDIKKSKEFLDVAIPNLERIKERLKVWEDIKNNPKEITVDGNKISIYYLTDEELDIVNKMYD